MRRIQLIIQEMEGNYPCDQESSSFYSSEVDRNLLRVSRPRATTDPAISGSERSKRDSRLTRSNSACGLDSVELELDFVFTSSSDSKQLDFGQGYLAGSRPAANQSPVLDMTLERELYAAAMAADEKVNMKLSARCEQRLHEASR
ncbi:unnamed protein product [Microthlaspi erraticum]|uniref:Uncharacterized protein n=1 Tax=Microthlaspi erraticum TaxID=1685480 RepID=A0A6D2L135_9BRAS|nr:unnamed protein product [Microthlaspi erraticum]